MIHIVRLSFFLIERSQTNAHTRTQAHLHQHKKHKHFLICFHLFQFGSGGAENIFIISRGAKRRPPRRQRKFPSPPPRPSLPPSHLPPPLPRQFINKLLNDKTLSIPFLACWTYGFCCWSAFIIARLSPITSRRCHHVPSKFLRSTLSK